MEIVYNNLLTIFFVARDVNFQKFALFIFFQVSLQNVISTLAYMSLKISRFCGLMKTSHFGLTVTVSHSLNTVQLWVCICSHLLHGEASLTVVEALIYRHSWVSLGVIVLLCFFISTIVIVFPLCLWPISSQDLGHQNSVRFGSHPMERGLYTIQ